MNPDYWAVRNEREPKWQEIEQEYRRSEVPRDYIPRRFPANKGRRQRARISDEERTRKWLARQYANYTPEQKRAKYARAVANKKRKRLESAKSNSTNLQLERKPPVRGLPLVLPLLSNRG